MPGGVEQVPERSHHRDRDLLGNWHEPLPGGGQQPHHYPEPGHGQRDRQ